MSKISGQFLISGQFQDICEISGISGQLGALHLLPMAMVRLTGKAAQPPATLSDPYIFSPPP